MRTKWAGLHKRTTSGLNSLEMGGGTYLWTQKRVPSENTVRRRPILEGYYSINLCKKGLRTILTLALTSR